MPPEHHPAPIDPRPRQLLERYTSLIGALPLDTGNGLIEFEIPPAEQQLWDGRTSVTVALTPDALNVDPDAELLGIGSPVFERLVTAVRARGHREHRGLLVPSRDPDEGEVAFPVEVEGAAVEGSRAELSMLPIGRLVARVSIKAGALIDERLVESPPLDLSTGVRAPGGLAELLSGASVPAHGVAQLPENAVAVAAKGMDQLLPLAFDELEEILRDQLATIGRDADQALAQELARLERYYTTLIADIEADAPPDAAQGKRQVQAEHARRRGEEEDRYRTTITVHPLQLIEWSVLAQQVTWSMRTPAGVGASFLATRLLSGEAVWDYSCPTCGGVPAVVRVCRHGHASCSSCSARCGVCGEVSCAEHGLRECAIGSHPVCADHASVCRPCGRVHCGQHAVQCSAGDHRVCPECAVSCAICDRGLCRAHAVETASSSPRGTRWLCDGCVVLCEGSQAEPVGRDEAVRCASCERYVCEHHQTVCAVDGQVHCSGHLRRSDRSGRLSCEQHRSSCEDEPGSNLASDEVSPCATCGKNICDQHGGSCAEDGERHCTSHLLPLADQPGRWGCEAHRTTCHVDGVAYSLTGTRPCPACANLACEKHRVACSSCARQVCMRDVVSSRCVTCARLEETAQPGDDLIQASLTATGGALPKAKRWRTARDAFGTVVELELGWTRRLVFTVPHEEVKPRTVVQHSLLGSKRLR